MSLKHSVENVAVRSVSAFVRLLPAAMVGRVGAGIGLLAYAVDRRHRVIARQNVAAALPARSAEEQRAIVRGAFQHFGRLLLE
ncbi:MAG: hypothetical protein LBQ09_02630, partial [Acidobacteriaceae bacterium]|nr:hypothetical protein [Acidobacteriaceae bacterium]